MEISPNSDAWLALPDDVREKLKIHHRREHADPEQARAAVGWARQRRRKDVGLARTCLVLLAVIVVWALLAHVAPGLRVNGSVHTTTVVTVIVGALLVLAWLACLGAAASATRLEATHLAAALGDAVHETPGPTTLSWRHSRATRITQAVLVGVLVAAFLWVIWLVGDTADHVVDAIFVIPLAARWAYTWPWPIASSYAYLATIETHELRVHPLGLTVPWHRVSRVRFGSTGTGGAAIFWHIDDPVAVVADTPVSPAQQRRLLRWLTANGGAVRLSAWQLRESPEDAYLASERIRTGRSTFYRQPATSSAPVAASTSSAPSISSPASASTQVV